LACLPDNLNFEGNIHPEKCVATGWGKDRFGNQISLNDQGNPLVSYTTDTFL